jgi:hypothetical protein
VQVAIGSVLNPFSAEELGDAAVRQLFSNGTRVAILEPFINHDHPGDMTIIVDNPSKVRRFTYSDGALDFRSSSPSIAVSVVMTWLVRL